MALGLVLGIACGTRLLGLDMSPIELDEWSTYRLSQGGMRAVFAHHDSFPQAYLIEFGSYHWFLNLGLRFIDPSPLGVRLPNALAGVLAVLLVYALERISGTGGRGC